MRTGVRGVGPVQRRTGTRLAQIRRHLRLSVRDLDAKTATLGRRIPASSITKMELGSCGMDLDDADVLARATGVPYLSLVGPDLLVIEETIRLELP